MFYVQAGRPAVRSPEERGRVSLRHAMRAVFEPRTEALLVVWQGVPVRVAYHEELGFVLTDVVYAIERMTSEPAGRSEVGIYESTLSFEWRLSWSDGTVELDAKWHTAGVVQSLLDRLPRVSMPIDSFAAEWKMPMRIVRGAIEAARVEITHEREPLETLARVEARIPRYGILYEHGSDPA